MSNPRARREVRHRQARYEREVRQARQHERRDEPRFGWHDDGDSCTGPGCLNPEHFEP